MPDCHPFEGGGCAAPRPDPKCAALPLANQQDSGLSARLEQLPPDHYLGGGACAHAPPSGVGLWAVVVTALWLLRRCPIPWALVLVCGHARAVDVYAQEVLDGGPIPGLHQTVLGSDWNLRMAGFGSLASNPVVAYSDGSISPYMTAFSTAELGGSLQLKDWFILGAAVPAHRGDFHDGTWEQRVGQTRVFLRVPLSKSPSSGSALQVRLQGVGRGAVDADNDLVPWTSSQAATIQWLTARTCSTTGGSLSAYTCPWWFGAQLGARLQVPQAVGSLVWASRWESMIGLRRNIGPVGLGGSLNGSAPLALVSDPTASWPLEAAGTLSARAGRSLVMHATAAVGLTRGLGTPESRIAAGLHWIGEIGDKDGDGFLDPRDLCPQRAEDMDGFRDGDGCPEEDNDRDGLVDAVDQCPLIPEVWNDYKDDDGCPDERVSWVVTVHATPVPEQVWVEVDGLGEWSLERTHEFQLKPGAHSLKVRAEGFYPVTQSIELSEGSHHTRVQLVPMVMSALTVALETGAEQTPLQGEVRLGETSALVPENGRTLPIAAGRYTVMATANGYEPTEQVIQVPRDRPLVVRIAMEPKVQLDAQPPVLFSSGSHRLGSEGQDLVTALAAWLAAHPEVLLLEVVGHADEVGGSAYNLALSEQRAQSVASSLIDRGVAQHRLRTHGTGEAHAWVQASVPQAEEPFALTLAGVPTRQVSFQVLVWADDHELPTEPSDGA